ncbi:MAG TPA: tRNA (adenosine(37)-N6)-dimethylallyltransferase MiaA [Chitinophagaceae bacterium]
MIIIAGPTAVGKTAAAIEVAKHFHTAIISADSRQCYKEMNIGVARPTSDELKAVPHYFIATHSIHDDVNASLFEKYALQKVNDLFKDHDVVVMVGGTGLYIKAFCEGLDEIPAVPEEIRKNIIAGYQHNGLAWLQSQVQQKDPAYYKTGEIQNPQRLMRALEVFEATGKSITTFQKKEKTARDFRIIKIGLQIPKEELHQRINGRVDKMIADGLVDEVKNLYPFKSLVALQTVGYKEIIDFIDKKISLEEAIELVKINTRRYAKRQLTWFRKDKDYQWFDPGELEPPSIVNSQ